MRQELRMKYLEKIWGDYQKAGKKEKGNILNEFCRVCGYNRKYAIRLLNSSLERRTRTDRHKGRYVYSHKTISILEDLWEVAGYPWSERFKAMIPLWMPWIRKQYDVDSTTRKEMVSISARQMDRRLARKRSQIRKRRYGTTRPGSLLKHQIPIRTKNWDITQAGYVEIDTVAHCGNSAAGEFMYTLDCVDIQTTWVERRAVMGKGEIHVLKAFQELQQSFPFRIRGIDSDNGGEFINHHLYRYCHKSRPKITFTRGRPYEPKDSAHIEQKNWTHVRKIFGWDRYASHEALLAFNDLYRNELQWWHNFFQPSVKQLSKLQKGSRWIRRYDTPKTPFQRVLESPQAESSKVSQLKKQFASLNPFELSQHIDRKLEDIFTLAVNTNHRSKHSGNSLIRGTPFQKGFPQTPFQNSHPLRLHSSMS
jgi:hypothetical protein